MGYMRNQECSDEVKQLIKDGRKKFVRLDEGAILYSIKQCIETAENKEA